MKLLTEADNHSSSVTGKLDIVHGMKTLWSLKENRQLCVCVEGDTGDS